MNLYLIRILLLSAVQVCLVIADLENWPTRSFDLQVQQRAQRDVSYSIPIDQSTQFGVSVKALVFEEYGYSTSALPSFNGLLNMGIEVLTIDLYYNNFTSKWQLCPAPFPLNQTSTSISTIHNLEWNGKTYKCEPDFTPSTLMAEIRDFITGTNTNMDANYLQILYRLNHFTYPKRTLNSTVDLNKIYKSTSSPYNVLGNATLSDTMSLLGPYLFTPTDLKTFRASTSEEDRYFYNQSDETFPSLEQFIFTDLKRATVAVIYDEVTSNPAWYNYTSSDNQTIFINNGSVNLTLTSMADSEFVQTCVDDYLNSSNIDSGTDFQRLSLDTHFRYAYDDDTSAFDDTKFRAMIRCGYSPILNSSTYSIDDFNQNNIGEIINHYVPLSSWAWSPKSANVKSEGNYSMDDESKDNEAVRCVLVYEHGWYVGNCYDTYPFACQHSDNPTEWIIRNVKKSYFDAEKGCPKDYTFGISRSSMEMLSLMEAIAASDVDFPVWIDVNDITVINCFVTGGPYADCPYQRTVSTKGLAGLIAPSFVVAVVVLLLLSLEKIFRVNPIQTNRKRFWKKKINEHNKTEYEGVPS